MPSIWTRNGFHLAIVATGAKPGTPTGFIDQKTGQPKYTAATGSKVKVSVHYKKDGKLHEHRVQEWIWDVSIRRSRCRTTGSSPAASSSRTPAIRPRSRSAAPNSGDIFSISANFPYSTLEFPVQISKDDAQLTYEARTDKIPPLTSKVWVLVELMRREEIVEV